MGKSKGPRKPKGFDIEAAKARVLCDVRKAFRKKFGRDPHPGEPVFFDETKDVPTPISHEELRAAALEMLSDLPPQFTYAYEKTGRLLLLEQLRDQVSPEIVEEWDEAIDEYFAMVESGLDPFAPARSDPVVEALGSGMRPEDRERLRYSEEHPAFVGHFDIDMIVEILGERFTRKLRCKYKHTPDDEYYDLLKRSVQVGWGVTSFELQSRPEPERDDPDQEEFEWSDLDFFVHLLPDAVWDKIHEKLDEVCAEEDARRRMQFLEPGGTA